jgi:hypothetical protein
MYDEGLTERIREALEGRRGITEKRMFGGLAFMLNGNMFAGIIGEDLMVRVGPEAYAGLLKEPFAKEMDFTGRPMKGFIVVGPEGFDSDEDLAAWIGRGIGFAESLPDK